MVTTRRPMTGGHELVPKGSRLIGQYSSAVLLKISYFSLCGIVWCYPMVFLWILISPDTGQIGQSGEPADYSNRHFLVALW